MRPRLNIALNVLLVVVLALLGILTNYATGGDDAPLPLDLLRKFAVPGLGVLIVALIVLTAVSARLENPPRAPEREWDPGRTPYPGLEAFAEDEAAVFFGRDEPVSTLLRQLYQRDGERFVVVAGASGSGKSSLVQAGLIPRLRGRRWLVQPVLTPGSDPIAALATTFGSALDAERLRGAPSALAELVAQTRRRSGRRDARVLITVDQLEELFTLAGSDQRDLFLSALSAALRADSRLWVVATVRIEFLRSFLETGHAALFARPIALGALTRAELATVVEAPGTLAGLRFEPGLVTRIVEDTGTADALPLLAYLLQELYFAAGRGKVATFDAYRRLGGVAGALSRQADQLVIALRGDEGIEPILAVLFKFVTTEGTEATRRRVVLDDLSQDERRVVTAFVEARLLITDVWEGTPIAQVAHEALFRQWAPLRQEVEARAELLRRRAELERWAADWRQAGHKADYLLTGERLQLALQWLEGLESAGQDSGEIRAFIEASKRRDLAFLRRVSEGVGQYVLANAEQYPELAILLAAAALSECPPTPAATRALMAALAFSHLTHVLDGHTDAVRNLAWSPDGALIATASRDGTCRLWDATTGSNTAMLEGHHGMVEMVAWAPDARRIATASRDHTVRVWDTATGHTLAVLAGATDVARTVAWSPDGTRIASGARDRVVRIWRTDTYELLTELHGHTDNILGIAFSPSGNLLATGSHDRTVRIWDLAAGSATVLHGHQDFVEGVAWSPDGAFVASAGGDGTMRIWDIRSSAQTGLIRCHGTRVWNVAWSPDGAYLASCGSDNTARVWNPRTSEEIFALRGHTDDVWGVVWSPDGTRLATGSADTTARIWDVTPKGAEGLQLAGHRGPVRAAAVTPSGRLIATAGDDATIRIWDAADGTLHAVITAHQDTVHDLAWNSVEGRTMLLSCSSDRTIGLWRLDEASPGDISGERIPSSDIHEAVAWCPGSDTFATAGHDRTIVLHPRGDHDSTESLAGHHDWVVGLAWSPTGTHLGSTSDDRTARIWNVHDPGEVMTLHGHANWVDDIAWSPDARRVVTGSADGTARVWDATTGEQLAVLDAHEARVAGVAWSPDGFMIATASYDRTVRLWAGRTYAEIGVVGVHRGPVVSVTWTPDSQTVISASFDGTARLWPFDVDLDVLKSKAGTRVFRPLAQEERLAHLLPEPGQ
ncbi:WD40 repeat domain-containing protein [Actinomadura sp. NPDC000929]|uniref:nSTAND1 domain-containing NTPase n=1 Tax=Actinomadura sp. NPDC000929 TaxID=3154517 RepID=UPI0033986FD4